MRKLALQSWGSQPQLHTGMNWRTLKNTDARFYPWAWRWDVSIFNNVSSWLQHIPGVEGQVSKEERDSLRKYLKRGFCWRTKRWLGPIKASLLCLRVDIIWNNFPDLPLNFSLVPSRILNTVGHGWVGLWGGQFSDLNSESPRQSQTWMSRISFSSHRENLTAPLKSPIYVTSRQQISGQAPESQSWGNSIQACLKKHSEIPYLADSASPLGQLLLSIQNVVGRPAASESLMSRNAGFRAPLQNLLIQSLHFNKISGFLYTQ